MVDEKVVVRNQDQMDKTNEDLLRLERDGCVVHVVQDLL